MIYLKNNVIERLNALPIKLYADSGCLDTLINALKLPIFSGITTNPSLLKKAGSKNYHDFLSALINVSSNCPISFGTSSDCLETMILQARKIHAFSNHIYVKIPIVTSTGQSTAPVIKALINEEIKINITAIMTLEQAQKALSLCNTNSNAYLSIFAGRIADTGINPENLFKRLKEKLIDYPQVKTLWASVREVYNIFQAANCGADIITLNDAIIQKLPFIGMDLDSLSQEMVSMFHQDAKENGVVEIS